MSFRYFDGRTHTAEVLESDFEIDFYIEIDFETTNRNRIANRSRNRDRSWKQESQSKSKSTSISKGNRNRDRLQNKTEIGIEIGNRIGVHPTPLILQKIEFWQKYFSCKNAWILRKKGSIVGWQQIFRRTFQWIIAIFSVQEVWPILFKKQQQNDNFCCFIAQHILCAQFNIHHFWAKIEELSKSNKDEMT